MKLSLLTLIMCASSASISVADAKRFSGRGPFETTEGLAERRLEEFEMSIPTPTEESPAESIEKQLKENGVDEATISTVMKALKEKGVDETVMKALDGGTKMTGSQREECAAGVKMIFLVAALLPGELFPGLETLIDLLLCGPKEETKEETCVAAGGSCGELSGVSGDCCDKLSCALDESASKIAGELVRTCQDCTMSSPPAGCEYVECGMWGETCDDSGDCCNQLICLSGKCDVC